MNLDAEIEAILYYRNEPITLAELSAITGQDEAEIKGAVAKLSERLQNGGTVLISKDDQISLGTSPGAAAIIEKMVKDDLAKELGKATLDTLTIILYYGPISKSQIDNIRGVNSGFILRNLLVRGLIAREAKENDQRSYIYKSTLELLSYLGIKNIDELPEYKELRQSLDKSLAEIKKYEPTNTEAQN